MSEASFEMDKTYNPQSIETETYQRWEKSGAFVAHRDASKKPFTIVMPPPNITGQLHMGHAMDNTLQDTLVRYHRMKGDATLWLPGTDHASIATEVKIVDKLRSEGLTKQKLGREEFLKRAWEWKKEYGGTITRQLRSMGSSCEVIEETIQHLNEEGERLGLVKVHLFRPFSAKHLLRAIPATCTSIAVLDRTKEPGSLGEPLYLDVCAAFQESGRPAPVRPPLSPASTTLASRQSTP